MLLLKFFIQEYPKVFYFENGKEFVIKFLDVYLVRINVKHILV